MSHFDTKKELLEDKRKKEKIGILIGFQFNDGRKDLIIPAVHSIHELHYYYEHVVNINNNKGVKFYAVEELFQRVSKSHEVDFDLNGFHLTLFSSLDEVNCILNEEECFSVGCFMHLFEGNPDATSVTLVDFDRWNEVVEMMKTTTQEEFLNNQKQKNNYE
jgi:hypothetical protein